MDGPAWGETEEGRDGSGQAIKTQNGPSEELGVSEIDR